MSRTLKALGLAMLATFALSAVAVSAAQAAFNTHHFTTPTERAVITASDHEATEFLITGGAHKVTCGKTLYEGTSSEKTNKEVTVVPTYSECKVDGTITATVDVNHCAYVLKGNTDVNGDAEVELECAKKEGTEEHTEITITYSVFGSACVVHVHPTQQLRGVHYTGTTNPTTGKKDITVKLTVKGIKYQETGGGFCPATVTKEDGELKGAVTAQAYEDKKFQCCTGLTTPVFEEGNAIDLELNENVTEP